MVLPGQLLFTPSQRAYVLDAMHVPFAPDHVWLPEQRVRDEFFASVAGHEPLVQYSAVSQTPALALHTTVLSATFVCEQVPDEHESVVQALLSSQSDALAHLTQPLFRQ